MCRWLLYMGPELRLDALLTKPAHSLIHQSYKAKLREEPLNGDGFGLAWYAPHHSDEPALFRSIQPAWNDVNLLHLARVTESGTVLAHVRAATAGLAVMQVNCHPFTSGRFAFMHNGAIGSFHHVRRTLLARLSDEAFDGVVGTTDSEYIFALFLDAMRRQPEGLEPGERLAGALADALRTVLDIVDGAGVREPTYLNIAVTEGAHAVASRVTHLSNRGQSLFVHTDKRYEVHGEHARMVDTDEEVATIVASEPLSEDPTWKPVDDNTLLLIRPDRTVEKRPFVR